MARVTTTDSSTPCCKKIADPLPVHGLHRRAWILAVASGVITSVVVPHCVHAQTVIEEARESELESASGMELQRNGDDLLLTAVLNWTLPPSVQDALLSGIPVHFVAEVDMLQERWYWSDKKLLQDHRYMRLSYQPLTRRWRLYTGSQPFERQGLSGVLSSTFDTLDAAVQAMQRIARWRIGQISELPESGSALLRLRFRIDVSHFPRPLQIGALGRSDWNLLVTRQEMINLGQLQ